MSELPRDTSGDRVSPGATELSLSFPQGDGNLSVEARAEILVALREVPWRRVWLNDVVWINTGAVGGPTIDFTAVVAGTISGVAVVVLTALAQRVFHIARAYFPFRIVRLRAGDKPEVEYLIGPEADADAAVNAIPADYEATISTERTVRRWRHGRWEVTEIATHHVSGGPGDSPPPSLTSPIGLGSSLGWATVPNLEPFTSGGSIGEPGSPSCRRLHR